MRADRGRALEVRTVDVVEPHREVERPEPRQACGEMRDRVVLDR